MNFEEFRADLESKLNEITKYELQEFHYTPSSFGDGLVAYRIKGVQNKLVYEGREQELVWKISKPHQKYLGATWTTIKRIQGLEISKDQLKEIITSYNNT